MQIVRIAPIFILSILLLTSTISCGKDFYIHNLATDMIMETDVVYSNGYPTEIRLEDINDHADEDLRVAEIHRARPNFSWMIVSKYPNTYQAKYHILVSKSLESINSDIGDVWDSGEIENSSSVCVPYQGEDLSPATVYYWKVKITDTKGRKYEYSAPKAFITALDLDNYTATLPLQKFKQHPTNLIKTGNSLLADFGNDAFGQLSLRFNSYTGENDKLTIDIGEKLEYGHIDTYPHGSIRHLQYDVDLIKGYNRYKVEITPEASNTDPNVNGGAVPVLMPQYIGEVLPFRYAEISNYNGPLLYSNITRETVNYPFNDMASSFECSDTVLNQVWENCKHTMKATSFAGIFVDGDRERITYEGDALINQLSHYAVDYQYSIARATLERLMTHPTWPTEWILSTLMIAYYDYLYTGDASFLDTYYEDLKLRTLWQLRSESDHLLHSGSDIKDPHLLKNLHTHSQYLRDIIDWPRSEQDRYDKGECNTVVNAHFYNALYLFARIAETVGNNHDAKKFGAMAQETLNAINDKMLGDSCLYTDHAGSSHSSLHANMYPLAFGIASDTCLPAIIEHIQNKGMACSVYGAQFLIEALYNCEEAQTALNLLADTTQRSWYEMIRRGSTMTTESWNERIKDNEDWNHPWGAAPANLIVRKLMGIEPTEPGFARVRIKPQTASLEYASVTTPTPRGPISVSMVSNGPGKSTITIEIPANTTADIILPNKKTQTVGSGIWNYKY